MAKQKDFSLDKAFMAVKAQRYDEALQAYEASLDKEHSVEAWTGLGIAKLFQLLDNQTMEEVIFCFQRAKEVKNADCNQIELDLINYSTLVVSQGANYCVVLLEKIKEAEKAAGKAALATLVSGAISLASDSTKTSVIGGVAAGAGAGVTAGKLNEISNAQEAGKLTLNMMKSVILGLESFEFSDKNMKKLDDLRNTIAEASNTIELEAEKSKPASTAWYNTSWKLYLALYIINPLGLHGLYKKYKEGHATTTDYIVATILSGFWVIAILGIFE